MVLSFVTLTYPFWLILIVYWVFAARNSSLDVSHQTPLARTLVSGGLLISAALMYFRRFWVGWLGITLIPPNWVTGVLGLILCAAGLGLAVWARQTLGDNWSAVVTAKPDQTLVERGPYRWARHPIYTGTLLLGIGTALVVGMVSSVVAVIFLGGSLLLRVRDEEKVMLQQFPEDYPRYQRRTRLLIPWLF